LPSSTVSGERILETEFYGKVLLISACIEIIM
jgi:hypothetical protein